MSPSLSDFRFRKRNGGISSFLFGLKFPKIAKTRVISSLFSGLKVFNKAKTWTIRSLLSGLKVRSFNFLSEIHENIQKSCWAKFSLVGLFFFLFYCCVLLLYCVVLSWVELIGFVLLVLLFCCVLLLPWVEGVELSRFVFFLSLCCVLLCCPCVVLCFVQGWLDGRIFVFRIEL